LVCAEEIPSAHQPLILSVAAWQLRCVAKRRAQKKQPAGAPAQSASEVSSA
jgi:hypothetical protein